MTVLHVYMGIEDLALNAQQRADILAALDALGPQSDQSPAHLNHWRTRLDNRARIYEALFDESALTVSAVKGYLANAVGVDPADVDHVLGSQSFAGGTTTLLTLSHNATDYVRVALFGGPGATWLQSLAEVAGYVLLYASEWEGE